MSQQDIFGQSQAAKPFRDIRSTRPSVAEEKATLALQLGRLISTIPDSAKNGSVQTVRYWRDVQAKATKVAKSQRASVQELSSAINSFNQFLAGHHDRP